ncbi:MAG: cation-efflux pump [Candidatus Omnitrophica bacterium]|nr:cation-efflux pump [Candidatus Omnitrophota bacterium]MBU4479079.1 cation-efflux pump [Candidatus Omnitrophota bacterium]MCG2703000.1 cation-efflux pump [Candidatus Omnitrophota bacterium]
MDINITEFLLKKTGLDNADPHNPAARLRFGYLEGWVSVFMNIVIFLVKMLLGIISGSISIIADAVHTSSDVATSAIVIWGFKISHKPADKEHPFGHGRMENIATLIIAVLLCVVGMEILQVSVRKFFNPSQVKVSWMIIIVLFATLVAKEWMARFSFQLAKKIDSSTLYADAWHHRSDAVSTLLVIAALIGSMFKLFMLDAIFGALVSGYIVYTGAKLVKDSSFYLLGNAADEQLKKKIKQIAQEVDGVEGVHDIVAHDYGTIKAISLHVEVAHLLDSIKAHEIATTVETRIAKQIRSSPIVHIDLKRTKRRKKGSSFKVVEKVFARYPEIINSHGVEILSNESGDFLSVHIIIPKVMTVEQSHSFEHKVQKSLKKHFNDYKIGIHIEPCNSQCAKCSQACKDGVPADAGQRQKNKGSYSNESSKPD